MLCGILRRGGIPWTRWDPMPCGIPCRVGYDAFMRKRQRRRTELMAMAVSEGRRHAIAAPAPQVVVLTSATRPTALVIAISALGIGNHKHSARRTVAARAPPICSSTAWLCRSRPAHDTDAPALQGFDPGGRTSGQHGAVRSTQAEARYPTAARYRHGIPPRHGTGTVSHGGTVPARYPTAARYRVAHRLGSAVLTSGRHSP